MAPATQSMNLDPKKSPFFFPVVKNPRARRAYQRFHFPSPREKEQQQVLSARRELLFPPITCLHSSPPSCWPADGPQGHAHAAPLSTQLRKRRRPTFRHQLFLLVVRAAHLLRVALHALAPGPLLRGPLTAHEVRGQAQLLLQRGPHQAGRVDQTQVAVPQRPGRERKRCPSRAFRKEALRSRGRKRRVAPLRALSGKSPWAAGSPLPASVG